MLGRWKKGNMATGCLWADDGTSNGVIHAIDTV